MTRLALVNPGRKIEFATCEPLNLECIASYVQQYGIEVRIIDELAGQNVMKEIMSYRPDLVGITATTPLILDAYRIADKCRELYIRTVIGGVHATILSEEALQHADIVVKGEGEVAMLRIIQQEIKSGIVEGEPLKNLDDIPRIDKSNIETDFYLHLPETYLPFVPSGMKVATLVSSRGCSHNCIFCHNSYSGIPYRCNSVKRVMNEIHSLIDRYGIKGVYFFDDNFFMNKPRVKEISYDLVNSNISIVWGGCSRVDNVDIETLRLAWVAGCRQITFGFESGSQRILDVLNKKTTIKQNAEAIRMCHEVGIKVAGTFMVGNPTETEEDIKMTQQFIKDNPIDSGGVRITTPFPATQLWKWSQEHHLVPEQPNWSEFLMSESKNILACDTIPYPILKTLYKETVALLADTENKVSPKWFINMGLHHPLKSLTIALRSSDSWARYLYRLKR